MKWAILLGSPDISGGSYVIFEHAIRAKRRGVDVTIITEKPVSSVDLYWHPEARIIDFRTFDEVRDEKFDVALATWWRTVFELHRVDANAYGYFVQSIESWFYPPHERPVRKLADSTYFLDLPIITEATWIQDYLRSTAQCNVRLVRNGIRKDIYTPDGECLAPREPGHLRVLVEGSLESPFKNVERTIDTCRRSQADEVWLLTPSDVRQHPKVDRLISRIPIFDTPKVYRSCDVLVKLSYVEGMFGPPLEMFHCGGTAITYDVTGHDEYIRHDENALIAPRDDEQRVVDYLNRLKNDDSLRTRLIRGAAKTAHDWSDWDQSSRAFEQAVRDIAAAGTVRRETLRARSIQFMELYAIAEESHRAAAQYRSLAERKLRTHAKEAIEWWLRHKINRVRGV